LAVLAHGLPLQANQRRQNAASIGPACDRLIAAIFST